MHDRPCVYLQSVYKTTWNPPAGPQKVDVCTCKWEPCTLPSAPPPPLARQPRPPPARCDRPCSEPGLLLSLCPSSPPCLPRAARSEGEREREPGWGGGQPLTSGTRCGNSGDAPRCDSGRQEQAQTQEPSVLPRRQRCRGLRVWRRSCLRLLLRSFSCLLPCAL